MKSARAGQGVVISLSPAAVLAFLAICFALFMPLLGTVAAMGFLGSGLLLVALRPSLALGIARQEWLFGALLLWCLLSTLWSDHPSLTLRYSIQLAFTVAVGVTMAYRFSPDLLVRVVAAAYLIAGVASLTLGRTRADGEGYLGIFNSKNALAGASSLMIIAGLGLLVDNRQPRFWRATGMALLATGAILVVKANSVGTLVSVGVVLFAYLSVLALRRLKALHRLLVLAATSLLVVLAMIWLSAEMDRLSAAVLDLTGKDVTLTGRTELWGIALEQIAARPLGGTGFQAFWVAGNPLAEELWSRFHIASRGGFNFHNTLLSNAVEIGVIGAALQAMLVFGAAPALLAWVVRERSAGVLFLALLLIRQLVQMWVEVEFFLQFQPATILTVAMIAYAHRWRREGSAVRTRGSAANEPISGRRARAGRPEPWKG